MSENIAEIKGLIEGVESTFADLKTEQEDLKSQVDTLTELKLDRMVGDITEKLENIQKENTKLQAAMNRPGAIDAEEKNAEFALEQKAAFDTFLRTKNSKEEVEIKAMSTDVDPDGGYLVRPEFSNFIVDRVFETSPIRQVANVITTGSKSVEMLIDDDEADANWAAEGSTPSETDTPELGLKTITAHRLEALPKITMEMLDDAYLNVETWLQGMVADKFSRVENAAFINGNGVGKPRGLLTYAAGTSAYARETLEQVNIGATSSTIGADGLIELQNSLKEPYQQNAVFGMDRTTYGAILKLKGNDNYFFGNTMLKDGQLQPTLLGKPVLFLNDMPAVDSNALAVVYGDFSKGYTIVDRVGLQVLRDPYTSKGFMTYFVTKRTGGDVTNYDSLKIGKVAT